MEELDAVAGCEFVDDRIRLASPPERVGRRSMKIVVVGGSGLIGSKLVSMLTHDGHEAVAASRRSGVDAVTGEGLAEALSGAAVVVDVSNSPSFEDDAVVKFFKTSMHNLLTAEAATGVRHHVMILEHHKISRYRGRSPLAGRAVSTIGLGRCHTGTGDLRAVAKSSP
jgi:uncharacterized protein YbjT (DUF2867 family)